MTASCLLLRWPRARRVREPQFLHVDLPKVARHAKSIAAHHFALLREPLENQMEQDNNALEKVQKDREEFSLACRVARAGA